MHESQIKSSFSSTVVTNMVTPCSLHSEERRIGRPLFRLFILITDDEKCSSAIITGLSGMKYISEIFNISWCTGLCKSNLLVKSILKELPCIKMLLNSYSRNLISSRCYQVIAFFSKFKPVERSRQHSVTQPDLSAFYFYSFAKKGIK